MSSEFAPIALFVYNRPEHTRRVLEALRRNALAAESDLVIFSDAPRKPDHQTSVGSVRVLVRETEGFKSVRVVERERNLGLANSIIDGVTHLCEKRGRVIVVEDDLIVAPHFLTFMNQALNTFAKEPRVMQISGYMFPVDRSDDLPGAFFIRLATSWGWATWRRAWSLFRPDSRELLEGIRSMGQIKDFNVEDTYPFFETLLAQARGEKDVWGVRWYASMYLHGGLCLYPRCSLVRNIGMDSSGVHCGTSTLFDVELSQDGQWQFPADVKEYLPALNKVCEFFNKARKSRFQRLVLRVLTSARSVLKNPCGHLSAQLMILINVAFLGSTNL
jgi:GT2 family glycosyltransferase